MRPGQNHDGRAMAIKRETKQLRAVLIRHGVKLGEAIPWEEWNASPFIQQIQGRIWYLGYSQLHPREYPYQPLKFSDMEAPA